MNNVDKVMASAAEAVADISGWRMGHAEST
ncbi:hypothetical protein QFZ55_006986 [Streptomyces luteogriseus]|nr:hypothetical protein [Streptomyces luteogriseus]